MNIRRLFVSAAVIAVSTIAVAIAAQAPTTPVPRPFPGAGSGSGSSTAPARPAPVAPAPVEPAPVASQPLPAPATAPTPATPARPDVGDVPIYPTAEYLATYDAGMGQRYVLFGSDDSFETIVAYYKQGLKNGGRTIYEAPAVQQWDLGRFQDERMAYPPSVVVKDYSTRTPAGYLFVKGTSEKRYRTVIQVVPPPPAAAR